MRQDREQEDRIAGAMKLYAAGIEAHIVAPDVDRVWRKADAFRKEMALRRAMRSLLVMRVLGGLYVFAMLVWCMKSYLRTADGRAVVAIAGSGILVAALSLVVASSAGVWFMLRESRKEFQSI